MALPISYTSGASPIRSRHHAVTHNWEIAFNNEWKSANDTQLKELSNALEDVRTVKNDLGIAPITMLCTQVSVPNTNISTVEFNIKGVHFHQIQTRASTPIQTSLVFYELHDYRLYRFFELWKALTVSRWDGSQNPSARLVNGVSISLYTTDRSLKVMQYDLYDTFCASAQISDPQNAGSPQQLAVTLQSANYGIFVPDSAGQNIYKNPSAAYLGTYDNYITATGTIVKASKAQATKSTLLTP